MTDEILKILLLDQTTGKNILWANAEHGQQEILFEQIDLIVPRHEKNRELQKLRTKTRAEIFTPPNVCEIQNDLVDANPGVPEEYIDAKFLEITCGEAPYITSRYNAVTGEYIPIDKRVGLLDRKLNFIRKEYSTVNDWTQLTIRAVQSVYGYEFQGDNLFLARRNIFDTVVEYFAMKFSIKPPENFWTEIAEIISWNFWQMDGLECTIPYEDTNPQGSFDFENNSTPKPIQLCKIIDWRTRKVETFKEIIEGGRK